MRTRTRYARNGEVSLAYEVYGRGDRDILVTFGWVGSFQSVWENPEHARWLERLATLGRVIVWDKRGTGLSDRVPPERLPTMEERMDDLRAVMDAAGSERSAPSPTERACRGSRGRVPRAWPGSRSAAA